MPDGHKKVLQAMAHYQKYAAERTRFQVRVLNVGQKDLLYKAFAVDMGETDIMGSCRQIFQSNAQINHPVVILISWRLVLPQLRLLASGYINTVGILKASEDIQNNGVH